MLRYCFFVAIADKNKLSQMQSNGVPGGPGEKRYKCAWGRDRCLDALFLIQIVKVSFQGLFDIFVVLRILAYFAIKYHRFSGRFSLHFSGE